MKYVDTLVSFSEIPDEITLCINISNCPNKCEGCHSSWLQENIGIELNNYEMTNAIEYACGVWGSTYLVEEKGFEIEHGALALTIYYVGMSIGRFASGLLANKIKTWKRIFIGCVILAPAIVIMLLPLGDIFAVVGLFLIGLGNGSIYPNMIHLTPHNFGKEVSQSIMGSQIAFAYIGVMLAPPMVSLISSVFGIKVYPVLLALLYIVMVITIKCFVNRLKKQGRYSKDV